MPTIIPPGSPRPDHVHLDGQPLVQIGWWGQTGRVYAIGDAPHLTEPGGCSPIYAHWGELCGHQIKAAEKEAGAAAIAAAAQPHSRACGITPHPHGPRCSSDCPTCLHEEVMQAVVSDMRRHVVSLAARPGKGALAVALGLPERRVEAQLHGMMADLLHTVDERSMLLPGVRDAEIARIRAEFLALCAEATS